MPLEKTFISYARVDSTFALKLANDLRQGGANIWLDQIDIRAGSHWDASIEEAINSSPSMILILSPASVESNNVMDEVAFALENRKKVIPILMRECQTPFRLRRLQRIDFTGNYQQGLISLFVALGVSAGEEEFPIEEMVKEHKSGMSRIKLRFPAKKLIFLLAGMVLVIPSLWLTLNWYTARQNDLKLWRTSQKLNNKSAYINYLSGFPNGVHAASARQKIDSFRNAEQAVRDSLNKENLRRKYEEEHMRQSSLKK